MRLDDATVLHVARLANLALSPDEVAHYREQLSRILAYVDELKSVDDDAPGTPPQAAGTPERDDVMRPSLPPETAVAQAPQPRGTSFQVPKIIE
jgi:aspartyl-tRNA(Asn)/glutamyl-tRNA(Gln) amidotransferase subunit C